MASTKDDAARRRAERRARIRAKINELQSEIDHLESCKRELFVAKSDLAAVEAEINNAMQVTENVNANLSGQYPGNRYNNLISPHIENILAFKGGIKSNITAYRNELNVAINDLEDAINARVSEINYYQDQL